MLGNKNQLGKIRPSHQLRSQKTMCREAVKIHQAKAAVKSSRIFLTRIFLGVLCNVPWIDVLLAHSGSRTLRAFLSCLWFISRDLLDLSYSEKAAQMVPALQFPILHAGRYSPPAACSEHLPLPVLEDDMPSLHEFDFFFFTEEWLQLSV